MVGVSDILLNIGHFVAHDCGYPLSRYTCRATRVAADFLDFIAFCRCSTGVALHPLKILVSHPPPLCREVTHRNLGLKRCRATRGCRKMAMEHSDVSTLFQGEWGSLWEGKQGRFVILRFPLFYSSLGFQDSRMLGKQHWAWNY